MHLRRGLMVFAVGFGLMGVTGCTENGADIPKGEVAPNAPKSSEDAMKNMGKMAPQGSPEAGKRRP